MDIVSPEIPTRVTKQLKKLGRLLAVILGKTSIDDQIMNILQRVARDTADQKRQKIVDAFCKVGIDQALSLTDIAGMTPGLHYKTASNQIILMEALEIVQKDENGLFRLVDDFKPLIQIVSTPSPLTEEIKKPEKGLFSALTGGEGIGLKAILDVTLNVFHQYPVEALSDETITGILEDPHGIDVETSRRCLGILEMDKIIWQPRPGFWRLT